jgi:uncharacterized membrane protein SpoIIM required for sporulation|tara:strand:+ start:184 stop:465 length:282 start_codon:yes stop_codon:yes gene_type:complete
LNKKKEVVKGVLFALLSSLSGLVLAILFLSENDSIIESLKNSYYENFLGKLISLGAILNVLVFFIFIKKNQDQRAKGVLLFTIFLAIFTLILN